MPPTGAVGGWDIDDDRGEPLSYIYVPLTGAGGSVVNCYVPPIGAEKRLHTHYRGLYDYQSPLQGAVKTVYTPFENILHDCLSPLQGAVKTVYTPFENILHDCLSPL